MRASRVGTIQERFNERFKVNPESGCWEWTGLKNAKGYGRIGGEINGERVAPKGTLLLAHRVSWLIHKGAIPDGEGAHGTVVMHKCDNPSCVNPEHLMLGSQTDNVRDMHAKGRRPACTPSGAEHWNAAIKDPAAIELIRSTKRNTKALAEQFGVHICTIKRIRRGSRYAT